MERKKRAKKLRKGTDGRHLKSPYPRDILGRIWSTANYVTGIRLNLSSRDQLPSLTFSPEEKCQKPATKLHRSNPLSLPSLALCLNEIEGNENF